MRVTQANIFIDQIPPKRVTQIPANQEVIAAPTIFENNTVAVIISQQLTYEIVSQVIKMYFTLRIYFFVQIIIFTGNSLVNFIIEPSCWNDSYDNIIPTFYFTT